MEKILFIVLGVLIVFILNIIKRERYIGSWISLTLALVMSSLSLIFSGWEVLGFLILAVFFAISFIFGTVFYGLYIVMRK